MFTSFLRKKKHALITILTHKRSHEFLFRYIVIAATKGWKSIRFAILYIIHRNRYHDSRRVHKLSDKIWKVLSKVEFWVPLNRYSHVRVSAHWLLQEQDWMWDTYPWLMGLGIISAETVPERCWPKLWGKYSLRSQFLRKLSFTFYYCYF